MDVFAKFTAGVHCEPPLPQHATRSLPGSNERVIVMRARLERGESIHHPDDLRCETTFGERATENLVGMISRARQSGKWLNGRITER